MLNQQLAPLTHLVTEVGAVAPCANSQDCAPARREHARRATGRGSNPGSPAWRASVRGWRSCSPPCSAASSSSAGRRDYADRGETTLGSTCIYGDVPGPCVPLPSGDTIAPTRRRASAQADSVKPAALDLDGSNSAAPSGPNVDARNVGFCRKRSRSKLGKRKRLNGAHSWRGDDCPVVVCWSTRRVGHAPGNLILGLKGLKLVVVSMDNSEGDE